MSVLHLLPSFDTGGLGSLGLTMIRAWPEKTRHMVIAPRYMRTKPDLLGVYASLCGGGSVAQIEKSAFVTPPAWGEELRAQIAKFIRGKQPTHVINYNFTDAVWNSFGVHAAKYPGKMLCHVGTVLPDKKETRLMAGSAMHYATKFIPASQAARDAVMRLGAKNVLPVVWNGVDLAKYDAPERDKALVFGFTGRMAELPVKDWRALFDAFRKAKIPEATIRIAGDGPGRAAIEAHARGLPVEFVGNLTPEQIPGFLASLDVFVMAALPIEGFSMAMVEAFASRCLMLGTDVSSVREVFAPYGGKAFLAKDANKLAKAMKDLQNPEVRAQNRAFVNAARASLDAARMAQAYYDAGL